MLNVQEATSGLLFGSFLYDESVIPESDLKARWEKKYGPSFYSIPSFNPLAKYYSTEMGDEQNLKRFFALTSSLYQRQSLLSEKLVAVEWEKEWAINGKRKVNVDIGFLSAENFLLATTKNYSHRVFLGNGIFADLTYQFHQGKFETFPWTYPDYQDQEKIEFFTWGRSFLLNQLTHSKS